MAMKSQKTVYYGQETDMEIIPTLCSLHLYKEDFFDILDLMPFTSGRQIFDHF